MGDAAPAAQPAWPPNVWAALHCHGAFHSWLRRPYSFTSRYVGPTQVHVDGPGNPQELVAARECVGLHVTLSKALHEGSGRWGARSIMHVQMQERSGE